MPTTERDHEGAAPEGAGAQRTPVDHPSRRLHTSEIDDLVEAALSERVPIDRARNEAPMPDPYVGVEVDRRYVIESLIAAGGMGLVYRCRHRVLGKKLAMKIIRSDVAHMPDGAERFMLEAKAASSIGNEHIVDIGDFGAMPDGSPYLVMEYLEGISLAALLRKHPRLDAARIAGIASQIAEGLGAAHAAGIVHRDLKPDNVFVLDRKGEDFIKVLDFGVARMAQSAKKLTQAGTIVGTPHYMSPEQALGLEVDHRGDIYALGIIMYEMLAGRVPFDGDHYVAVLHQHLQTPPPTFASLEPPLTIPNGLERVIGTCLAKAPEDRYATMEELARELAAFREPSLMRLTPPSDAPRSYPAPRLPAAPSLPPALPPASLARVAQFHATARLPEPAVERAGLAVVSEQPAAATPGPPHHPTLALPRPSGPFTLPQRRFVTALSVAVLLGVCALAAFQFGTAPSEKEPGKGGANGELPVAVPSPAAPSNAAPSNAAPSNAAPSNAAPSNAAPSNAAPSSAESAPTAPLVLPPLAAAGAEADLAAPAAVPPELPPAAAPVRGADAPSGSAGQGAGGAASASAGATGAQPRSKESRRAAARERREASQSKRAGSRSTPRSRTRERERQEFMNPWPAPRR